MSFKRGLLNNTVGNSAYWSDGNLGAHKFQMQLQFATNTASFVVILVDICGNKYTC